MAKTAERGPQQAPSPKDLGRQLRSVRRRQGLSRSEVARSAGLTRRELAAYERGRVDIPESDLWCLAGSCGVDVGELLPHRDQLHVDSGLSSLAIGDTIRHLRSPGEPDGLLREYLSMIYELRNLPPGSRVPLREADLSRLADALGGAPDVIEHRLAELIGANREEAARLRAMILPPLSLPPPGAEASSLPPAESAPIGMPGPDLAAPTQAATDAPAADFFATPRAADPFAPPPPLEVTPLEVTPLDMTPLDMTPLEVMPLEVMPLEVTPLEVTPLDVPPVGAATPDPLATDAPTAMSDSTVPSAPSAPAPEDDPLATLPVDPFALAPDASPADITDALPRLRPDPFAPAGESMAPPVVDVPATDLPAADTDLPVDADSPLADAPLVDTPLGDAPIIETPIVDPEVPSARHVDPDAARDGIVVDLGEPTVPIGPEVAAADPMVAPHTVLDVPAVPPGDDEAAPLHADDVAPVTPITWRAPVDAEVDTGPAHGNGNGSGNGATPKFTKAGPAWEVGGMSPATAMADDGALALRRTDARWALSDVREAGDFTAEAVLDFTAGTGFGILFRASVDAQDRISGYSFDVDAIAGGGGYLVRQWKGNRPHWRPLAQASVTDPGMLFGRHTISITVRGDQLTVHVDDESVVSISSLSRLSIELGREPCRGDRLGVQAGPTTEVTVDSFAAASH